jgi:hypothetical protein
MRGCVLQLHESSPPVPIFFRGEQSNVTEVHSPSCHLLGSETSHLHSTQFTEYSIRFVSYLIFLERSYSLREAEIGLTDDAALG